MRIGIVPELRDERMTLERGLDDAALNASSASVDQAHFRQAGSRFGGHVENHVPGVEWNTGNLGQGLSTGAASALAARVSANALAAHQIALNMAALTFMVPYGLASAAAVRVGHAVGRRDPLGAIHAGWTAIAIGVAFMATASTVFLTMPGVLMRAFTADAAVIATGITLLFVAAVFQLFDGVQGVTTGALRGLGDTRTAMLWNLGAHWAVGLPRGYLLCFRLGYGVVGLWWGLSTGLMICGVGLLAAWRRQGTRLAP